MTLKYMLTRNSWAQLKMIWWHKPHCHNGCYISELWLLFLLAEWISKRAGKQYKPEQEASLKMRLDDMAQRCTLMGHPPLDNV